MAEQPSVLIATADDESASALQALLFEGGARGRRVKTKAEALLALDQGSHDVLIVDAALIDLPSADLSRPLLERDHELPLIVLVDGARPGDGAAAVRAGAADFLRKPVERDEVAYVLGKALKSAQPSGEEPPRSRVFTPTVELIGRSEPMQELQRTLRRAADGIATVLVRGESGTGKELVARLVHEYSPRRAGPYVKVHCAALPDQLLESELFGYERGAFTGATARKPGRVELAEGGTRCSSTKLATLVRQRRSSCCASCRSAATSDSAALKPCLPTCASSPPRIVISKRWCVRANFAKIYSIV